MFYKNLEHYENTLKKIVREKLDTEIGFDSDWAKFFITALYESSDREGQSTVGFEFLQYVKNKCYSMKDLMDVINECRDCTVNNISGDVEDIPFVQESVKDVLLMFGYVVHRRSV